jgi:hypothetical protein
MFVNALAASSSSVNITTLGHQSGDLLLVFALRAGSSTAPTLEGTHTSILTRSQSITSARALRVGWKLADGTETSTGTWTNADHVVCAAYRLNETSPIGASASVSTWDAAWDWPALTLTKTPAGNSWVIAYASGSFYADDKMPSGYTSRISASGSLGFRLSDSAAPSGNRSSETGDSSASNLIAALIEVQFRSGDALFWSFP